MSELPLVSVNLITYNRQDFIHAAIDSVLKQSYNQFELIVIDDGSTDNTLDVINSFYDRRIFVFKNEKNSGIAFSRNKAAELSRGKYILILDSDDVAHPELIKRKVEFLEANPDYILVSSLMNYVNEKKEVINKSVGMLVPDNEVCSYLFFANCLVQSSLLIRATILKKEKYSDSVSSEDLDLWNRIKYLGGVHIMEDVLINVALHNNNVTKFNKHNTENAFFESAEKNLKDIGLKTTDKIIGIHVNFLNYSKTFSVNELKLLIKHCSNIITANNKEKKYNKENFDAFIFKNIIRRIDLTLRRVELPVIAAWLIFTNADIGYKLQLLRILNRRVFKKFISK
jgi:glycosyltransferase involved in cell wall biosynthesis